VKPPYLVIDGRRMIPDYSSLVEKGYQYLAVGGALQETDGETAVPSANGAVPEKELEKQA